MGIVYQPSQRWVSCRRAMQCVVGPSKVASAVLSWESWDRAILHDTALAKDRLRDPPPGFWPWPGDPYPDTREVGIYFQRPITMNHVFNRFPGLQDSPLFQVGPGVAVRDDFACLPTWWLVLAALPRGMY